MIQPGEEESVGKGQEEAVEGKGDSSDEAGSSMCKGQA